MTSELLRPVHTSLGGPEAWQRTGRVFSASGGGDGGGGNGGGDTGGDAGRAGDACFFGDDRGAGPLESDLFVRSSTKCRLKVRIRGVDGITSVVINPVLG